MSAYLVTVRTASAVYRYTAIAASSAAAIDAAIDRFGVAAVSAKPEVQHG